MTQIEKQGAFDLTARSKAMELLQEAFLTAYIVTRSEIVAEQLVCLVIDLLQPTQLHSSALVAEALRLSVQFTRNKQDAGRPGATCLSLGNELSAVMELESEARYSYVARVLLGHSLANCVELLQTDAVTITKNLLVAMRCISERHQDRPSVYRLAPFVNIAGETCKSERFECAISGTR